MPWREEETPSRARKASDKRNARRTKKQQSAWQDKATGEKVTSTRAESQCRPGSGAMLL